MNHKFSVSCASCLKAAQRSLLPVIKYGSLPEFLSKGTEIHLTQDCMEVMSFGELKVEE